MPAHIMHIDMDAFFASVEQQANPALRGQPVIVGGRNNKYRSIVVAASYEAKALGISSAMPSWEALRICPQAKFVPTDTAKYIHTSNGIHQVLRSFTPHIEKFSIDEFFLDLSACERSSGSPIDIGRKIKCLIKQEFGITCSIGAAPTRITAKLAAKKSKPDGLIVMNKQQVLALLEHLPIDKICGIGRRLKKRFNRLGIETCGQLAQYPDRILRDHFGVNGLWLKAACRAEDLSIIKDESAPRDLPRSVGHSQTLKRPSTEKDYIETWIYLLSEMVAHRLRQKGLQGRTVYFYIADGFGGGSAKRRTFTNPTHDGYEIYRRCQQILAELRLPRLCARVLGVSVSGLGQHETRSLFERQNHREHLLRSLDEINERFGDWTIYPAQLKRI